MSGTWATAGGWLLRLAVGGGLLLLLTWVLMRLTRQPARRQRLGEWGLAGALLVAGLSLAPAWIRLSIGLSSPPPAPEAKSASAVAAIPTPAPGPEEPALPA